MNFSSVQQTFRRIGVGSLIALAANGCGARPPAFATARLEGDVTYRGLPVEEGGVTFGPETSGRGPSIWAPLVNGHFTAPAVPLGKVRVQINAIERRGTTQTEFGVEVANRINLVPLKYRSGVTIDVEQDRSDQNFELAE